MDIRFPVGKLDSRILADVLRRIPITDPRVIVGPAIGADAAAIDCGDHCLVVATDPVTFAGERLGWYAVQVNANDVATMGARPRWLTAVLLLPGQGTDRALVDRIVDDLLAACRELGVTLIGGHTEITYDLPRPIIVGQMLGEVAKDRLLRVDQSRPGHHILLCKGVGIEATSLMARERAEEVRRTFGEAFHARACGFLENPGISIVAPALLAAEMDGVRAMHDPTEGGVATALYELAAAAHAGVRVRREAIHVYPECARLCAHFGLDPLGVIASGALLIVTEADAAEAVAAKLTAAGYPCRDIGELTADVGRGVLLDRGAETPLPAFRVDEITRLFR